MSRIVEHLSEQWIVASALDHLFEHLGSHRGVYVLDLTQLSPQIRDVVRASLDMKAKKTGVYRTNINGADVQFSIVPFSNGLYYELKRLSTHHAEEPIAREISSR